MADEQLFKTALNGFNKDDVISYIEGINRAAAENQDWFDRQSKAMSETIRRLTKENKELKSAGQDTEVIEKLQQELLSSRKECAQLKAQFDEQAADVDRLRKQLQSSANRSADSQLRSRLDETIRERDSLNSQLEQAKEQINQLTAECSKYKSMMEQMKDAAASAQSEQVDAELTQAKSELEKAREQNASLHEKLEMAVQAAKNAISQQQSAPDPEQNLKLEQAMAAAAQAQLAQTQMQTQLAQTQMQLEQTRLQLEQAKMQLEQTQQRMPMGGGMYGSMMGQQPSYASEMRLREAQDRIAALEDELNRTKNENEYMKMNMITNPEELRSLYDKSRLYDDIKNNVAKIVTDARKKAADMISEAETQSKQLMSEGLSGMVQIQRRIKSIQNEIEGAQKVYNDTSISMSSMFNSISDAVKIADNQLISVLGANTENGDMWKKHN